MIWTVLALCVLCIVMSCVALWYRAQWDKSLDRECDLSEMYEELNAENARTRQEIGALNIEIGKLRSQLPKRDSKGRFCKRKEKR